MAFEVFPTGHILEGMHRLLVEVSDRVPLVPAGEDDYDLLVACAARKTVHDLEPAAEAVSRSDTSPARRPSSSSQASSMNPTCSPSSPWTLASRRTPGSSPAGRAPTARRTRIVSFDERAAEGQLRVRTLLGKVFQHPRHLLPGFQARRFLETRTDGLAHLGVAAELRHEHLNLAEFPFVYLAVIVVHGPDQHAQAALLQTIGQGLDDDGPGFRFLPPVTSADAFPTRSESWPAACFAALGPSRTAAVRRVFGPDSWSMGVHLPGVPDHDDTLFRCIPPSGCRGRPSHCPPGVFRARRSAVPTSRHAPPKGRADPEWRDEAGWPGSSGALVGLHAVGEGGSIPCLAPYIRSYEY